MVAYIFTSVKNRCIDYLRRKIIEQKSKEYIREKLRLILQMKFDSLEILDDEMFSENETGHIIEKALQSLSGRCREILIRHKIDGMKQKDIARELNISPKTVENQLTIAYKKTARGIEKVFIR